MRKVGAFQPIRVAKVALQSKETTVKPVSSPASGWLGENPTHIVANLSATSNSLITSRVFGWHVTLRAASHVSTEVTLWFESAYPQSLLSPSPEHLSEDAADAPQVHWCGVAGLEQHLWGSVPERHHLRYKHTATCQRAPKPPNKMGYSGPNSHIEVLKWKAAALYWLVTSAIEFLLLPISEFEG